MAWQPLEHLRANPEFFGGATGFEIGRSLRGLIPRLPAKAAPPKDLGFFYAVLTAVSVGRINTGADNQRAKPGG